MAASNTTQPSERRYLPKSGPGATSIILGLAGTVLYVIYNLLLTRATGLTGLNFLLVAAVAIMVVAALAGIAGMFQKGRSLILPYLGLMLNVAFWGYFLLLAPLQ